MNHDEIIRRVRMLDFIRNDQRANAAVKTVLGTLAGSLSDEQARRLAEKFPGQLALNSFETGGRMQTISVADHTAGICAQFKISVHQARVLVRNVLHFAKEASGMNDFPDIKNNLPNDWAEAIKNA